jgi:hypothetical protein
MYSGLCKTAHSLFRPVTRGSAVHTCLTFLAYNTKLTHLWGCRALDGGIIIFLSRFLEARTVRVMGTPVPNEAADASPQCHYQSMLDQTGKKN